MYEGTDQSINCNLYAHSCEYCISALFPSVNQHFCPASSPRPSLTPRITQQICKNTLLISRQKWQLPSMTSAPCIPSHPSLPPSPSFHFHFSFPVVHLRHKYSLAAPPLCSCRLSSHLRGHADMPHTHAAHCIHTVTQEDMDSISCLVRPRAGYIQERSEREWEHQPMLLHRECYLTLSHSEPLFVLWPADDKMTENRK